MSQEIIQIIIQLIEKYPYLTLLYIITLAVSITSTYIIFKKYSSSTSTKKFDNETKKKLEEIYYLAKKAESDSKDNTEILRRIEINVEVILEKLRGKDL